MKYIIQDVYHIAGERITNLLIGISDKDLVKNIPEWFYQPNKAFDGKSPFEVCKEGHPERLERKLMDILTAAQGA